MYVGGTHANLFEKLEGNFQDDFHWGNDHLTEIHLIEIVIFQLIEIFNN